MSEVIEHPAPGLTLGQAPETPWERERRAFWGLLPGLRTTHDGQYVAIHNGEVVASGSDEIAVALEAYSRVGYVPVYLGHVTDAPPRVIRMTSPRRWRGQERS